MDGLRELPKATQLGSRGTQNGSEALKSLGAPCETPVPLGASKMLKTLWEEAKEGPFSDFVHPFIQLLLGKHPVAPGTRSCGQSRKCTEEPGPSRPGT